MILVKVTSGPAWAIGRWAELSGEHLVFTNSVTGSRCWYDRKAFTFAVGTNRQ